MSYADITTYLQASGIDTKKRTSGVNSKWVYTKELLADVPAESVLRLADELEIPHTYAVTPTTEPVDATFWEPQHGVLRVRMDDGSEFDCGPGDVSLLPSGHDAWVVGNEPAVVVNFQGMIDYAKSR